MSIAELRKDYSRASLSELEVAADPIAQFSVWLDEAIKAQIPEPTAMSVATVGTVVTYRIAQTSRCHWLYLVHQLPEPQGTGN